MNEGARTAPPTTSTPTAWRPDRAFVAGAAAASALATASGAAILGGSPAPLSGVAAYAVITIFALAYPALITAQVIAGAAIAASLLFGPLAGTPLFVAPVLAGVVATAELLAITARLDSPFGRDPRGDLRRAGIAGLLSAAVFGIVALIADVRGPGGFLAVVLAAAVCTLLGLLLVHSVD